MLIVPAIDLLEGGCVQIRQGDFDRVRHYGMDAASVAARFEQQGALWIHVVDLDAARGLDNNRDLIADIRSAVDVKIQVGGGVRTVQDAKALIELGADAVVVGTTLATHTLEVLEWAERWPSRIVGGIGISSDEDLRNVDRANHFAGAIVGTAIYEERVDLPGTIRELQVHSDAALWAR